MPIQLLCYDLPPYLFPCFLFQKGDLFSMIASHDDRLTALENFIQQLPQQDSGLYVPLAPGTTLTLGQKREVLALIDHAIDKVE